MISVGNISGVSDISDNETITPAIRELSRINSEPETERLIVENMLVLGKTKKEIHPLTGLSEQEI